VADRGRRSRTTGQSGAGRPLGVSTVVAMDYPLLNLLFGLALVLTYTMSLGLVILLAKVRLPHWLFGATWVVQAVSLCSAVAVGYLFWRHMPLAISRQLAFGVVGIGGLGALTTASLYRRAIPSRVSAMMVGLQLLASVVGLGIAWALYRSLVPLAPPATG
jgi:hypothetical protein